MTGKKKGRGKKPKGTTSNESSPAKSLTPKGSAHNTPLKRVSAEEGTSSTPVKIRSPGPKSKTMAAETETTPLKTRSPGPKSKTMPAETTPVKATTAAIAAILESKKGTTTPVKSVERAEPEPEPATPDTADESASSKEPTPVKTPKPSPKVAKVMPLPSTSSSADSDTDDGIVNDAESVIVSESEAGSAKKKPNKSPKVTPLKVKLKVSGPPAKKRLDLLRMPSYLGPRKEPSTAGATQIDIASSPSLLLAATRAGRKSAGTFSSPKTPKTPKSATKRSTPGGSPSTPTTGSSKAGPSGAKRAKTSKTTWYSRTRKEPPKSATFIDDDSDDDFIGPTPQIEKPVAVAVPSTDDSSDSEGEIIVEPKNMEPTQAEAR